jgi:3-oxoacyl-[acyl-carrier-protein] synthase-3
VPPGVLTNEDIGAWVDTTDEWIMQRTGISKRHLSLGENASDLGIKVAGELLKKSQLAPEDIDLILVTTVTPDYLSPSVACIIQEAIGAKNAFAMDINAACSGFVYGLSVAQKYLASGCSNVMLIGAEVLSKYVNWNDRSTCILFGDGAGGVILSGTKDKLYVEKLHSRGTKDITVSHQVVTNPLCANERKIDHINVDGRKVFEFAVKSVSENIDQVLKYAGMTLDDVDYIIPHQANRRIIEGIAKKMKIDISKFFINIENYGNTSSASIPIALSEMMDKGLVGEGDRIIMSGFGGGLTWGSILLEL